MLHTGHLIMIKETFMGQSPREAELYIMGPPDLTEDRQIDGPFILKGVRKGTVSDRNTTYHVSQNV
jgi:hypothetical protein